MGTKSSKLLFALSAGICCAGLITGQTNAPRTSIEQDQRKNELSKKPDQDQKSESKTEVKEKEDPRLAQLVSNARALPPEFAADSLIRIVESDLKMGKPKKEELLQEAFSFARDTGNPVKLRSLGSLPGRSKSGMLGRAYALNLDTLSLQCRIVKVMLGIDKKKARQLFEDIGQLKLKPLRCNDDMVYDVEVYYETLKLIAENTFTAKEKQKEDYLYFAKQYVDGIESPIQIGPVAHFIASLEPSKDNLQILVFAFTKSVEHVSGDDRSFSQAGNGTNGTHRGFSELIGKFQNLGLSKTDLTESYRSYLIRHYTGVRCSDNYSAIKIMDGANIDFFNTIMRKPEDRTEKEVAPIKVEDMNPSRVEQPSSPEMYWQSNGARELLNNLAKLGYHSDGEFSTDSQVKKTVTNAEIDYAISKAANTPFDRIGGPLSDVEKRELTWQNKLAEYITSLELWSGDAASTGEDYFHQKSILFAELFDIVPAGATMNTVVDDFLRFLGNSPMQRDKPAEWMVHFNELMGRIHRLDSRDKQRAIESIKNSTNPTILIYLSLQGLESRRSDLSN